LSLGQGCPLTWATQVLKCPVNFCVSILLPVCSQSAAILHLPFLNATTLCYLLSPADVSGYEPETCTSAGYASPVLADHWDSWQANPGRHIELEMGALLLTDLSLALHRDKSWLMLTSATYCVCHCPAGNSGKMQRAGDRGCGAD